MHYDVFFKKSDMTSTSSHHFYIYIIKISHTRLDKLDVSHVFHDGWQYGRQQQPCHELPDARYAHGKEEGRTASSAV